MISSEIQSSSEIPMVIVRMSRCSSVIILIVSKIEFVLSICIVFYPDYILCIELKMSSCITWMSR